MRLRDVGWLVFAGFWSLFGALAVLGMLVAFRRHEWLVALTAPASLLGAYWLGTGAWLRTTWAQQDRREPPPDPPALSPARARVFITLAAMCALACAVALGGQWIATR